MSRNKKLHNTSPPKETAILVGVEITNQENLLSLEASLEELSLLASTAGLDVIGDSQQKLKHPNPKTFIGSGKINEIQTLIDELDVKIIIFDEELNPRHQRELEKIFGDEFRILDRTALILDIFAQHAKTHEGTLQVELAQYEYRLPRLTRAWTHLARQAGGGGGRAGGAGGVGLRGPGEKQLEVDRRDISKRINHLKKELEKVRAHRSRHRARRKRSKIPTIALVGYTNAGKSTLLNYLTNANVYAADQLFATLDPTTRKVDLPGGTSSLFSDTVGFIQKLPTSLVAAFRATLEEISEADLLLHIVDITHPNANQQAESVINTLKEINADHIPILTILNKIDLLKNPDKALAEMENFPNAVAISSKTGKGIENFLYRIHDKLFEELTPLKIQLPYEEGKLLALFHEQGYIDKIEHTRKGIFIEGRLPGKIIAQFRNYELVQEEAA